MSLQPLEKRTRDAAGRRACAQLVRAVSSATPEPFRRAAAGSALARIHELQAKDGCFIIATLDSFDDARATVSALAEVYSVSLREVATPTPTPGPRATDEDQAQLKKDKCSPAADAPEHQAAEFGQPGNGRDDSRGAASSCGTAGGGAAAAGGAFPEEWVPLLVDSSALVADCLHMGIFPINLKVVATFDADMKRRVKQIYICGTAVVSALLHSDALPALSRLLSAEAQRGPARALLTPRQLATCLKPLGEFLAAAQRAPSILLPVSQAATAATTPGPSPVPPTPNPTPGTSNPPAAGASAADSAAASSDQAQTSSSTPLSAAGEPGGSATVPLPMGLDPAASSTYQAAATPQAPQLLGAAVLTAVAESGVVEAACKAAIGALEQRAGGRQQQEGAACVAGGDREELALQLLELPRQLVTSLQLATADLLPEEPLRSMFMGPCVQYALAAHSVSQLHAVGGGTTYGLPYDSLLPPVREKGKAELSCVGAMDATCWWVHLCGVGGFQLASCPLSSRGLFELCLRKAEVAADCWRRCNGLPAAVEAAASGSAGHSGSGSSSSKVATCQHEQGKAAFGDNGVGTGRHVGPGGAASPASRDSGSATAAAQRPRATLDPSQCPELALQAMVCSRVLMEGSCGVSAGAAAGAGEAKAHEGQGTGSSAGGSGGTDRVASHSGNTAAGEGGGEGGGDSLDGRETGGGSLDGQGPCGGGSGDGVQGSGSLPEEADGRASVVTSGGGSGGQGDGADTETGSGGRSSATEQTGGSGSGGSGSGNRCHAAWLGDGGPLARRWWRAAVAAVHCALDDMEAAGSRPAVSSVGQVLDLSLALPVSDQGPALPAAAPAALSAALDAGYLPCLERALRTRLRACNTPTEAMDVRGDLFGGDPHANWNLPLAFGDEREAAAFLATAAKVARRACQERARPGGDRKACAAVMTWLGAISVGMWQAADQISRRVAVKKGFRGAEPSAPMQEHRSETAASVVSAGGGNGGGSGGGCGGGGGGGGGGDSIRASGNGGDDKKGSISDRGSSGGGGSSSDSRCVPGSSAKHFDTGAGTCGGEDGVRSSTRTNGGGSSDGGGGSARGTGNQGCGDGLGGGGSSGGGGGSTDDSAAPPASGTSGGDGNAGSLSPPEQQLMRLLSFALPLWLPLWLDLAAAMVTDGRLIRWWHGQVRWAFELLELVQHLCADALAKKDLLKAESWRSIVGRSGQEVEGLLDGCRRVLDREQAAAELLSSGGRGAQIREEDGVIAEQLYKKVEEVRETAMKLDANLQEAMVARGEVEGGWEGPWPLVRLELLAPPCSAGKVLACCSNPRCAELAGDSEAGVVLRRCGGACGGAAAYCCAACQRAHWAAGHKEVCTAGKGRGGEQAGAAGTG